MARTYDNFDLEIMREGEGYAVRVRSPHGEARAPFVMALTPQEIRILGLTVARGRQAARSVQSREVDEVKAFGDKLFGSLFTGDVLACYHESLSQVRHDPERGLRVRLRLAETPELVPVPWEYLFDRRSGRFLALDDETPVVRYLDLPLRASALEVKPPLHVLVMISGPLDVPGLDTDLEWKRLNDALGDLIAQGSVKLDRLEQATVSALRWKLKADDYHVFHFIGHGGVDAITDRGVLILEDATGYSDAVEAEVLAGILSAEKTLRLAVLNACEGGRASKGDIFAGTAQTLVQQDVPAVIAMQFEISDGAAIALTHDFYKALAFGDPVDAALTEARRGLRFERRNKLEWGTPVLYMRASDGRLFDVHGTPAPPPAAEPAAAEPRPAEPGPPRPPPSGPGPSFGRREQPPAHPEARRIAELLHESRLAAHAEKWSEAAGRLKDVLELDPGHAEATRRLETVRQEEQLAVLFRTGAEHEAAGRHDAAIDSFQEVRKLAGRDYRGVDDRLRALKEAKKTRRAKRVKLWVRIGKVAAVIWVLGIIASLFTSNDDADPEAIRQMLSTLQPQATPVPDGVNQPVVQPPAQTFVPPPVAPPPPPPAAASGAPSRDAEAAAVGLSRYGQPILGTLRPGEEVVHHVTLEGGMLAVIAGSCDDWCSDLDLLVSEQGIVRAQDLEPDDEPVIRAPVLLTGVYQLTVRMPSCSATACGYRVQVYR